MLAGAPRPMREQTRKSINQDGIYPAPLTGFVKICNPRVKTVIFVGAARKVAPPCVDQSPNRLFDMHSIC